MRRGPCREGGELIGLTVVSLLCLLGGWGLGKHPEALSKGFDLSLQPSLDEDYVQWLLRLIGKGLIAFGCIGLVMVAAQLLDFCRLSFATC